MNPSPKPSRTVTIEDRERYVVSGIICLVLVLITAPHLYGYLSAGNGCRFVGTGTNVDDYLVYLSWIHQTAHGQFFIRNLFTTDQQPTLLFNLLISALGLMQRVAHVPASYVIDFTRIVGSIGLMALIYAFYRYCLPGSVAGRLTAFGFVCLSSGFGWMKWRMWQYDNAGLRAAIDAWQPEAYTFSSMYMSYLFVISTILIVGVLFSMLRCLRTGDVCWAAVAGICGLILGNIHSYDVLHVSAAWGCFMAVWTIVRRGNGVSRIWWCSLLALAMLIPTTWYVYHAINTNPVLRARANAPTLSKPITWYFAGYGLVFICAVLAVGKFAALCGNKALSGRGTELYGADASAKASTLTPGPSPFSARSSLGRGVSKDARGTNLGNGDADSCSENQLSALVKRVGWADWPTLIFVACWAVAGLAIIYLPVGFQRKMLMGEHIPLCLIAGWGAAQLTGELTRPVRVLILSVLVAASFTSNVFFIRRDIMHIVRNKSETTLCPVLSPSFVSALDYIVDNTPVDAAVVAYPDFAAYIPGYTGRAVWAGHWGETPDYVRRMNAIITIFDARTPDSERARLLRDTHAQYILYPTDPIVLSLAMPKDKSSAARPAPGDKSRRFADFAHQTPSYLRIVYQDGGTTADLRGTGFAVLKIQLPPDVHPSPHGPLSPPGKGEV